MKKEAEDVARLRLRKQRDSGQGTAWGERCTASKHAGGKEQDARRAQACLHHARYVARSHIRYHRHERGALARETHLLDPVHCIAPCAHEPSVGMPKLSMSWALAAPG